MSDGFLFTAKQEELISDFKHGRLRRINILDGSVRSGKTFSSLILWALWLATRPQDGRYLMVGKTLTTLKHNCLEPLQGLLGLDNMTFSTPAKRAYIFGRMVDLEGAADSRSEEKIRGATYYGAYVDELTLVPRDFFAMLLSRLSTEGAKLIATTNPDNPHHWLKADFLDNPDIDLYYRRFLLDDNTTLPEEYVSNLKKEYSGVFYQRFILGQWVAAEGAIYRQFADNPQAFFGEPDELYGVWIGIDFGGNGSAHAFSVLGTDRRFKTLWLVDEYYRKEIIDPVTLEKDFVSFITAMKSKYRILGVYADSAEQVLIRGLNMAAMTNKLNVEVVNARKSAINDRICFFQRMMGAGRFFVSPRCIHSIDALSSARWDAKHVTEDVRLDDGIQNVDSLDAMEYAVERVMGEFIR